MKITAEEARIKFKPDKKAQEMIWAHATGITYLSFIFDIVEEIDDDWQPEICVTRAEEAGKYCSSDVFNMGVYLRGKITLMSKKDLDSGRGLKEKRSGLFDEEEFVSSYDDLKPSIRYTESWMIPKQIVGVWMTQTCYERLDKRMLKRTIGDLPITIINI